MTFSCIYFQASFTAHIKLKLLCEAWKVCCCVGNGALGVFAQESLLSRQPAAWSGHLAGCSVLLVAKSAAKGRHYVLIWTIKSDTQVIRLKKKSSFAKGGLFAFIIGTHNISIFEDVGQEFGGGWEVSAWTFGPFPKINLIIFSIWFYFNFGDPLWLYVSVMTDSYCLWDLSKT